MKTYVAFATWLVLCFIGLAWALTWRLVNFDHQGLLVEQMRELSFDQAIEQQFAAHYGDLSNQAFHISQSGCFCQQVAQPHISSVSKVLTEHAFNNRSLLLKPEHFLLEHLPSTPAIVVFNQTGQLAFFGPYSTGLLCSTGNGFIERQISQFNRQQYYGATVISDAKGCYCPTKTTA